MKSKIPAMFQQFVGVSHGGDITLSERPKKQSKGVVPSTVIPYFIPIGVFKNRECKTSGYAGAKYYIMTLDMTEDILVLKTAQAAADFSAEYLLGKSRTDRGYDVDWPRVSSQYKGLLINLPEREMSKLPDDGTYEWLFSGNHILRIWDTRGLDISLDRIKNSKAACR